LPVLKPCLGFFFPEKLSKTPGKVSVTIAYNPAETQTDWCAMICHSTNLFRVRREILVYVQFVGLRMKVT
jgi:hypothetical protein